MPKKLWNHRKSWNLEGAVHYLTFSCFQRRPFLSGNHSALWLLDSVGSAQDKNLFDLWAFVIMPEHVHLLIRPSENITISHILSQIKRPVTRKALFWVEKNSPEFLEQMADRQPSGKVTYRFWQRGGGYDRNMRSVEDVHEKIAYIHQNPVRRGLVQTEQSWPWSSARAWETSVDEPIRIDRGSVPHFSS